MGPYCNFCNTRCFVPFPMETPEHILDAYGTSTIIATCRAGQELERRKVGYCYDDIKKAIQEAKVTEESEHPDNHSYPTVADHINRLNANYSRPLQIEREDGTYTQEFDDYSDADPGL